MFRPAPALTMVVMAFTLNACTAPAEESNDSEAWIDEIPCEVEVDPSPTGPQTLTISFTRSETSGGAVLASQSERIRLGGFSLETSGFKDTDEIQIRSFNVPIGVRVLEPTLVPLPFVFGEEVGEIDYFEECVLIEARSGGVVAGPIYPTSGILPFGDDFSMFGNDILKIDLVCTPIDGTHADTLGVASEVPENGSIAATLNGDPVVQRTGNVNGAPYPADYIVLPYNSDTVWSQ